MNGGNSDCGADTVEQQQTQSKNSAEFTDSVNLERCGYAQLEQDLTILDSSEKEKL